jgi:hypothetical protein
MGRKVRFSFLVLVMVVFITLTTACGGAFLQNEVATIDSPTVSANLKYVEGANIGPAYDMSVTVPDSWVNNLEVQNVGNKLYFNLIQDVGASTQLFFIEALSENQYWDQAGAHPGSYVPIINQGDTYFIYHLPIDEYYSRLSAEELAAYSAAIPEVIASFAVTPAN